MLPAFCVPSAKTVKAVTPAKSHQNNAEHDGLRGEGSAVPNSRSISVQAQCLLHSLNNLLSLSKSLIVLGQKSCIKVSFRAQRDPLILIAKSVTELL